MRRGIPFGVIMRCPCAPIDLRGKYFCPRCGEQVNDFAIDELDTFEDYEVDE